MFIDFDACIGYVILAARRAKLPPSEIEALVKSLVLCLTDTSAAEAAKNYIIIG